MSSDWDVRKTASSKRLTVAEINSAMTALETFTATFKIEKVASPLVHWRISDPSTAGPTTGKKVLCLVAGLHGREWEPPEALVALSAFLSTVASGVEPSDPQGLFSDKLQNWIDDSLSEVSFTKAELKAINDAKAKGKADEQKAVCEAIWKHQLGPFFSKFHLDVLPLTNQAGRTKSLAGEPKDDKGESTYMWRGNGDTAQNGLGVDINRNFPIPENPSVFYHLDVQDLLANLGLADFDHNAAVTLDAGNTIYNGTAIAAETTNLASYIDNTKPHVLLDFHTCGGAVLMPWACVKTDDAGTTLDDRGTTGPTYPSSPADVNDLVKAIVQKSDPALRSHKDLAWAISSEIFLKGKSQYPVILGCYYAAFTAQISNARNFKRASKIRQHWFDKNGQFRSLGDKDEEVEPTLVPGSAMDYAYSRNFVSDPSKKFECTSLTIELGALVDPALKTKESAFQHVDEDYHARVCDETRWTVFRTMEFMVEGSSDE